MKNLITKIKLLFKSNYAFSYTILFLLFLVIGLISLTILLNNAPSDNRNELGDNTFGDDKIDESTDLVKQSDDYYKFGDNGIFIYTNGTANYYVYDHTPSEDELIFIAEFLGIDKDDITVIPDDERPGDINLLLNEDPGILPEDGVYEGESVLD